MDTKVLSSGIRYTNLPESYVRPESERPNLSEVSEWENVPVIDLACDDRSVIVQQVADACKNYGFFQVINHEVPLEAVERVLEVVKEFFNLPVEEKLKLYSDDPSKTMRLSTSFNINKEKVHNWRDYLRLHCYPLDKYVPEWPSNPSTFKTINDVMYSYLPDHTLNIPESEFMCNFVHKVVKRWGSLPIRGFNQETITSKLKTDSPQVLYGLASKLIKKPKKLELLLDKYGLGVRSTAFRSQPSSGEQSSAGGGGEDHIIEGCYLGHESFATVGSSDLASPALNNTPSASDQSVGASALPQNRDGDEQPLPDRSLSDMEVGSSDLASPALNNTPSASDQSVGASALLQNRDGDEQPPPDRSLSDLERGVATPAEYGLGVRSTIQESGDDDHLTQVHPQCRDSIVTVGNLAKLPDNYGPGVGSTAFRSQPSGGEQSSPGGSGEDHIIEGRYQGHESSATAGSSDLASPALNNTPSASDQSVGASALPEDRDDDEQPPPDRSLFDMERGVAPPAERRLNPSSVAQICLPVSCGVCIAPLQIWYNSGTTLSPNAKVLSLFVELFGVAGLLLSFGAYWFQRKRKTSGVMTVMGCVATICGFLSILGTRFPEKAMLWLTAVLWGLPIAAMPFALKELV